MIGNIRRKVGLIKDIYYLFSSRVLKNFCVVYWGWWSSLVVKIDLVYFGEFFCEFGRLRY